MDLLSLSSWKIIMKLTETRFGSCIHSARVGTTRLARITQCLRITPVVGPGILITQRRCYELLNIFIVIQYTCRSVM